MRLLHTLIALLFATQQLLAQDLIVKTDKTEIKSKVLEITNEVIKYKKFEMPDGPIYNINKTEVFMILYQNGTKEYIEQKSKPVVDSVTQASNTTTNEEITEPGIYYYNPTTKEYLEIDGSNITNSKQGGFGETILRGAVSGLFSAKEKVTLGGSSASIVLKTDEPIFLFVIDVTQKGFNNSSNYLGNVQSPNDFFLVRLKDKKDSREIVIGKSNNVSATQGIDDKQKVAFTYQKIKKGYYKVVPAGKLEKGEYCFMFASASLYEGVARKVFDFSVQ